MMKLADELTAKSKCDRSIMYPMAVGVGHVVLASWPSLHQMTLYISGMTLID